MTVDINWEELGFEYINLPYRWRAYWKDGEWYKSGLETENTIQIEEGAPILHYGQGAFEGLKAFHQKDGSVQVFRPDENAKRCVSQSVFVFCHPWVPIFLNLYQI